MLVNTEVQCSILTIGLMSKGGKTKKYRTKELMVQKLILKYQTT